MSTPDSRPRATIICISMGVFASVMSTSMLSIAFGDVTRSFGISYATLQLRNVLFFSLFAIGLPLFGKVADRLGARRQFLMGLVLFCVSAAMSGVAWNWTAFLVFQSLQAVADAMLVPAQMSLIRQVFPENRIGWAFGWFAGVLSTATLIAPALGGVVVAYFEWRAIFAFLVFFGGLVLVLATFLVPAGRAPQPGGPLPLGSALGLLSVVISLQGVFSAALPMTWRWVAAGALAVSLVGFLVSERGNQARGDELIPRAAFRNPVFGLSCARMFLLFLGANSLSLFSPSYLRDVHHMDARMVGWIVLVESLVALPMAGVAGRLADVRPRATIALGLFVSLCGLLVFKWSAQPGAGILAAFFAAYALSGLGGTLVSPSQDKLAMLAVPSEQTGHYMGVFQMIQFVSGGFAGTLMGPLIEGEQQGVTSGAGFSRVLSVVLVLQLLCLASVFLERKRVEGAEEAGSVSPSGT